jgi:tetratricopeptide (TPR) repeat protein
MAPRGSAAITTRLIAGVLACAAIVQPQPAGSAAALIRDGKAAEAIPILEKQVVQSPADLRSRNLLGIALSSAGRRDEAVAEFRNILERDGAFLPALKNLAMVELQLGRDEDARGHFERAIQAAPSDLSLYFGMGQVEYRARHFAQAVAQFERSGDLYRQDPLTLIQYAESCARAGQTQKAGAARFEAGLLLAEKQKYAEAAAQFAIAREQGADPYESGFNLTLAQLNAKDYPAAVEAAKRVVTEGRATTDLYSLMARAHEAWGKTADAYEALRAATKLHPRDEAPYLELIALCVAHENYELSLEIADVALLANPSAYRVRMDRGVVLALGGRVEEAEKEFAKAAEAAGPDPLPGLARSIALMELGRASEAVTLLRRLGRGNYLVQWHLAEALIRSAPGPDEASSAEAMRALRRSIDLNPRVSRTHFLLGKLLGQSDEAVKELESALRLEPDDVPSLYLLAQVYRKRGDAARASALFARVTEAKAQAAEKQASKGALLRIVRESR